jgi:hypothetical protein
MRALRTYGLIIRQKKISSSTRMSIKPQTGVKY